MKPRVIVCLGATAAKVLLGPRFRITQQRGQVQSREASPHVIATWHPSYLLRLKGRPGGEEAYGELVMDLKTAKRYLMPDESDS